MNARPHSPAQPPLICGWREWVGLHSLGLGWVKAKVDTGARTSALHAFSVDQVQDAGQSWVQFSVHPLHRDDGRVVHCRAPLVEMREVTDSGGHREWRPVIRTPLTLGGVTWEAEFTLTNRDTMAFRMLLGRTAMRRRLLVNPARSFLLGTPDPS